MCGKTIHRRGIKTARAAVCAACKTVRSQALAEERRMRKAIDWYAVDLVVGEGKSLKGLTTAEVRMVVRQLSDRMVNRDESNHDLPLWRLTSTKVAELLHMSPDNIQKVRSRLPKATKHRCPECRGVMWVLDETGVVEEHGDAFHETCAMSGMKGLATIRPDLYQWAVPA
jgi:hypothetical protein